MCRLIQTGDLLYLPITQDPVPKTEDQLEEDAQVMMQLGTDKYASEMRARMMSASLLSDMESFKVLILKSGDVSFYTTIHIYTFIIYIIQAANPGAILEDFIRWYSPRDWIDDEGIDEWGQGKGQYFVFIMHTKFLDIYLSHSEKFFLFAFLLNRVYFASISIM